MLMQLRADVFPTQSAKAWPGLAFSFRFFPPWRARAVSRAAPQFLPSPPGRKRRSGQPAPAATCVGTMAGWDGRTWVRATGPVRRPSYVLRREPAARCRRSDHDRAAAFTVCHCLDRFFFCFCFGFIKKIGRTQEINITRFTPSAFFFYNFIFVPKQQKGSRKGRRNSFGISFVATSTAFHHYSN